GFWGGRFKDLLSCQGVHFQVMDLEKAIAAAAPELREPTLEFEVVNPNGSAEPLRVRVELGASGGEPQTVADKVTAAVSETFGIEARVDVLEREALPRSGYKLKRVVDA
ncbi:MAG TPA: hypothetical protein VJM33_02760, partial [Microthrixaceae bacterium]|nr:hypothetical protein [Microthrixaceae bacterium]